MIMYLLRLIKENSFTLQVKAAQENLAMGKTDVAVDEFDDHLLHTEEHTKYLLSCCLQGEIDGAKKERLSAHLKAHKEKIKEEE